MTTEQLPSQKQYCLVELSELRTIAEVSSAGSIGLFLAGIDPFDAIHTEAEPLVVVAHTDHSSTLLAGVLRLVALTDLTQFGNAHIPCSSPVNFNLWREI
jgi:hypothetical protein